MMSQDMGASPLATGLGGAEAPEPPSRLGPADAIPSAEDVLRELAAYVGAGGYNAETVDPTTFYDKIRWGIDHLTAALETDAKRYRRLRSIGAAPGGTMHLEDGLVMVSTNLDNWLDDYLARGIKPAPSHAVEYGKRYCSPDTSVSDSDRNGEDAERSGAAEGEASQSGGEAVTP